MGRLRVLPGPDGRVDLGGSLARQGRVGTGQRGLDDRPGPSRVVRTGGRRGDPGRARAGPDRGKGDSAAAAAGRAEGHAKAGPDDAAGSAQVRAEARRRRKARAARAGLGRSRGGLSSKVHAAVDSAGLPLAFVLTPGQAADCRQFEAVLEKVRVRGPVGRPRTRPDAVAADKAYSSKANRAYLRKRGITAVIPEKVDQAANRKRKGSAGGRPVAFDPDRYKQRNHVERCFQKIKAWRGLATRYDKSPES
ncbi:IS5 family transposase [Kitasatospora sp. NPDC058218]|uniref:IS5 family transposase n=1 Tax=Kitasatospora sp. NPDC058218 TaxID=3346385 RepID=UPI0036D8BCBB